MRDPMADPDHIATVANWLMANGVDPADVLLDSDLYVTGEGTARVLHYEACVRTADGRKQDDGHGNVLTELRTVPLTVAPPAAWRPHQKPTREALLAAVARVRELHQPAPGSIGGLSLNVGNRCAECGKCYRCPTIRALDALEPPR